VETLLCNNFISQHNLDIGQAAPNNTIWITELYQVGKHKDGNVKKIFISDFSQLINKLKEKFDHCSLCSIFIDCCEL